MDTGTNETEPFSFFDENLNEKLDTIGDYLKNVYSFDNLNNSSSSSSTATTPLNCTENELNFEKTSDLKEILNCEQVNKKQEVFIIKSNLMKRVENVSWEFHQYNIKINYFFYFLVQHENTIESTGA